MKKMIELPSGDMIEIDIDPNRRQRAFTFYTVFAWFLFIAVFYCLAIILYLLLGVYA